MGLDPVTVAIGGLILSGASAYQQYESGKDAKEATQQQAVAQQNVAAEQRKQAEISQRQADIQNARTLRAASRQARIAKAAVINAGASAGTMGSSGVLGGAGSIGSQESSNIGYFNQMGDLQEQTTQSQIAAGGYAADAGRAAGDAQVAQATGAQWGALGQLGGTIFQGAGGYKTIFSKTA